MASVREAMLGLQIRSVDSNHCREYSWGNMRSARKSRETKAQYKSARGGDFAIYRRETEFGEPEYYKVAVRFWRVEPGVEPVPMVLDESGLKPATQFSNFVRFETKTARV
jgi:hypothetical protein